MNIRIIAAVMIYWLCSNSIACPLAAQIETRREKQSPDFLLLKNGQVIECEVEPRESTEQSLVIKKRSGSRIHLNRNKIVTVAQSRSDIYWAKCGLLSATDSAGHLRLFTWCIKHELLDAAQNQIELLQFMDVSPDKLLTLVDKLQAATSQHERKVQSEKFATTLLPRTDNADSVVSRDPNDDFELDQIQQVGYEAPIEISDRLKLIERLERATDSIDGEAVVMFKRKIEPLLINSCYTAKCHSNDSMPLPLATLGKSKRIPKRMSQRNLYNVLKFTKFRATA